MKLPRGYRVGMKSLGRADINAPTRTFNAEQQVTQSMAGAASAVADLVGLGFRLHDEEQKTEARDRSLEIQRDLNQLHGENSATQQWDLEDDFQREKLEGVKFEKKSPDGQLRTVLSAAEVHSQVWTINRDKIVKQGLTGLNPDQQKRVMEDLRYPVSNLNSRTQQRSITLKANYLREKDLKASQTSLEDNNLPQAVEIITESTKFSDFEKAKVISDLYVRDEKLRADEVIFGEDPDAIFDYLAITSPGSYSGVLEPRQIAAYRREAERRYLTLTAGDRAAQEARVAKSVSDLEIAIDRGEKGEQDIEAMFEAGHLSAAKRTQLIKQADDNLQVRLKSSRQSTLFNQVIGGRALPDPYNKDLIEAANATFAADPTLDNGLEITVKSGIMPEALVSNLNAIAHNGGAGERQKAANLIESLQKEKPIALRKIPKETMAILEMTAKLSPSVIPKESKQLIDSIVQLPAIEREQRRARYKVETKDTDPLDQLDSLMDGDDLFDRNMGPYSEVSAKDLPDNMQADYLFLHDTYFMATGNQEAAANLAFRGIRSTYSATQINGDWSVMRYAPDREHNLPPEIINEDFKRFKKAKGYPAGSYLVSDWQTAKEKSKTYAVYTNNEDGLPVEQSIRYSPDRDKIVGAIQAEELKEAQAATQRHKERQQHVKEADVFGIGEGIKATKEFLRHKKPGDPGHSSTKKPKSAMPTF